VLNAIWFGLLAIGVVVAACTGRIEVVTAGALSAANSAVETIGGFLGIMCLWLGLLKIAEKAGLVETIARFMRPLASMLFPELPSAHPAVGAIMLNFAANLLGMGSAATPLGLQAMQELQKINDSDEASDSMCTFVLLNTSGLTLIPGAVVALRASLDSRSPTAIVGTTLVASLVATACVLLLDRLVRARGFRSW
jgi:spore maturation protein A